MPGCSSLLVRCCQETAGCLLSPSSGSTLSWSPVSTGPGPHPAYGRGTLLATTGRSPVLHCTALYCSVLYSTVISSHTGQRTAHVPTTTHSWDWFLHRHRHCTHTIVMRMSQSNISSELKTSNEVKKRGLANLFRA